MIRIGGLAVLVVVLAGSSLAAPITGTELLRVGTMLTAGPPGSWDAALVESPDVFRDGDKWRMLFTGYSGTAGQPHVPSIGAATAATPTGPWTDSGPILAFAGGPFVVRDAHLYRLFYICFSAPGYEQGIKALCEATSPDFQTWTSLGIVVAPQGTGWASRAIWHPDIVQRGSTYYLFVNANGDHEAIGYATSTDLVTWTLAPTPVLDVAAGWESAWVGDPSVYELDGGWWMAYYGTDGRVSQDGLAWTSDPAFPGGWQRWQANPVLPVETGETAAAKPDVVVDGGVVYHYYTEVRGAERSIALAIGK